MVSASGRFSHCCSVGAYDELPTDRPLEESWNSSHLQQVRRLFENGRYLEAGCPPTCGLLLEKVPDIVKSIASTRPGALAIETTTVEPNEAQRRYPIGGIKRLHLEINAACNLTCSMCDTGVAVAAREPLETRVSDAMLDSIEPLYAGLEYMEVQGGEPFFYKPSKSPLTKVIDAVARAKNPNLTLLITTNGTAMRKEWIDYLLDSDVVTNITISIDTPDPSAYYAMRGGSLQTVLDNVKHLNTEKRRRHLAKPRLSFASVLNLLTYPSYPAFNRLIKKYKADHLIAYAMANSGDPGFFEKHNLFDADRREDLIRARKAIGRVRKLCNRESLIDSIDKLLNAPRVTAIAV